MGQRDMRQALHFRGVTRYCSLVAQCSWHQDVMNRTLLLMPSNSDDQQGIASSMLPRATRLHIVIAWLTELCTILLALEVQQHASTSGVGRQRVCEFCTMCRFAVDHGRFTVQYAK